MLAEAAQTNSANAQIVAALRQASAETGSDFRYLLRTAMRESGLKSQAQSSTSSACGLFQFVDQTWLGLIKQNGAKYGLGACAEKIASDGNGRYGVAQKADREAILALRKDPRVAALMAGEFSKQTRAMLQASLGRDVNEGELYAAHFLGPAAAARLIAMKSSSPEANAADAFPQAAAANRNVFYRADGSAKTVREVYDWTQKQPCAGAPADAPAAKPVTAAAPLQEGDDLLMGTLGWQPSRPNFSALSDGDDAKSLAPMPFLLTPGVMDVLAGLVPSHR
ncbi:MAG: lytic transglycosylase domain-containing protein [Alphaproteobacteria bacterium]|nr:lytic transglycosylase domain-containing protein [Alphaproteobacteria bacterium]MBV9694702.1 lytic transglycosylase domain-containing protein [Alphaproteobacteria bacterium]